MNGLPRIEGWLSRHLRRAADSRGFLAACAALAWLGTVTGTFPATAVVVPAALLLPRRWSAITLSAALGSAAGATMLVVAFHFLGWKILHGNYPDMATHEGWRQVIHWVETFGVIGLFVVAISPLPQTPALAFFGIARHDYALVFVAILAGKALKYGLFAWAATRFPDHFLGDRLMQGTSAHGARPGPPPGSPPDDPR
ncbi:MAG: hypothetical protein WCJ69_17080 [Betaproteobacteria bacterium]